VVGHYAGLQARAWHWLVALNRAVNYQFPHGIEGQRLSLMADNGCQPTSLAFMRACAALGIRQAFTSYSNPKGNADTERFLRTLKEELVWLREWTSTGAFFAALDRWLADYNATYLHSALGYRAPNAVEAEHLGHATPLAAACSHVRGQAPAQRGGSPACAEVVSRWRSAGRTAGHLRRRLSKLSCAGWLPQDRRFVSGLPRSKRERRSATVS
jgi:hypothetical protein